MKTTTTILSVLLGLFINAASAEEANLQGDVGLQYASQNYFRGQSVSEEALQASIGADFDVAGLGAFVDFSTSQSLEAGEDKLDVVFVVRRAIPGDELDKIC